MMDGNYLYGLPLEIWELIFDEIGAYLNQVQLTCRLFRDIAARRKWRDVSISLNDRLSERHTTGIARGMVDRAASLVPHVARYIRRLTLELAHNKIDADGGVIQTISAAMVHADEIFLVVGNKGLSDLLPVMELLQERTARVYAKIDGIILGTEDVEDLVRTVASLETLTSSIEANIEVLGVDEIKDRGEILKYLARLTVISAVKASEIEQLVRDCPQIEYLASEFHGSAGTVVLPPRISEYKLQLGTSGRVRICSDYVTKLQLNAYDLQYGTKGIRLEFPNARTLELHFFSEADEVALERLKQLARGLDRFIGHFGLSGWLKAIAPIVCQVREEVTVMPMGAPGSFQYPDWLEREDEIGDLFAFMKYPHQARRIQLNLPFFSPEPMKEYVKVLTERCARLETFVTTNYKAKDLDERTIYHNYPYMRQVSEPSGEWWKAFEVDLKYIRSHPPREEEILQLVRTIQARI